MRHVVMAVLLLAAVAASPTHAAGKITVDPNAAPRSAPAAEKPDKRLEQKVTYQGGYKRLHAVAEDLSKMTGVTIRCGKDKGDWRVRDIPVLVHVRDMSLGRLLNLIAGASHTDLSSAPAETTKGGVVYRLFRTNKTKRGIEEALAARDKAARNLARWAWDSLAALPAPADPSSESPADQSKDEMDAANRRLTSRVLAALGPSVRDRMLRGESLTVRAKSVLPLEIVIDALMHGYDWGECCGYHRLPRPTPEVAQRTVLSLKLLKQRETAKLDRTVWLSLGDHDWRPMPIVRVARSLASTKDSGVSAPPDVSGVMNDPAVLGPDLKPLEKEEDWKLPMLQAKVRVQLPQGASLLGYSDVLRELAIAGGLNIVCEDFLSHQYHYTCRPGQDFGEGTAVKDVLKKPDRFGQAISNVRWFANEEQKLLVGWAADWQQHHVDLAPQSILGPIHSKLSGSGADLDDLTPVFSLTRGQFDEWVWSGRDLPQMESARGWGQAMWRLYGLLTPEDKALARSELGLPLAKLDASLISRLTREDQRESEEFSIATSLDEDLPAEHQWQRRQKLLYDTTFLANSTMRVIERPLKAWSTRTLVPGTLTGGPACPIPGKLMKNGYHMEITGKGNGEDAPVVLRLDLSMPFPAYMPEKEAQLRAEAERKAKEGKQKP